MDALNKDKFLILKDLKKFILDLENLLKTFPKKDIITRDTMYNDSLNVLELVIKASYTSNKEKKCIKLKL